MKVIHVYYHIIIRFVSLFLFDFCFSFCFVVVNETSNFEITINGTLVHSKKTKGDGFLNENTKEKADNVVSEISYVNFYFYFYFYFNNTKARK